MSVTLYLGRHGETKLNDQDRLRGWKDEPLNATGIKEAEAMGDLMKQYPIDRVYCSDLDRADKTAEIVAKHHGLKQIPRQWFRPLDYGEYNGKLLSEIKPKLLELNDIWGQDPTVEAPGGESFESFQTRNLDGLAAVLAAAKDGEQIMIVAHLRNCLLFHAVAMTGGPLKGKDVQRMDGKDWHQKSGAVSQFEWDGSLTFKKLLGGSVSTGKVAVS